MLRHLRRFLSEEQAATAVEYAVMLAMILLICIGSIVVLGTSTQATWQNNSNSISSAMGS